MALLALTFDDGPDPSGTDAVLAALAVVNATATFFVLGERVLEQPEMLGRVIAGGHDVQLHGFAHLRHPRVTQNDVQNDLDKGLAALATHGVAPKRWRVPWGALAPFSERLAEQYRLELVGWTLDTHDWRGDSPAQMLAATEPGLEPGAIVLMHDGVGIGARRKDALATARLIQPLVTNARARGLEPGPLRMPWPTAIPAGNPDFGDPPPEVWVEPPRDHPRLP